MCQIPKSDCDDRWDGSRFLRVHVKQLSPAMMFRRAGSCGCCLLLLMRYHPSADLVV